MKPTPLAAFKKSLATGAPVAASGGALAVTLRKSAIAKAQDAGPRRIKFTISTDAVDLDNDRVMQNGWDLSVYKTNPLVLWQHDADLLPLGKCVAIGVEGGKLAAVTEFVPANVPIAGPMAEAVYQMCRGGYLSATSVGFMPLSYEVAQERMGNDDWCPPVNFTKQKLLEFSIVTIPSNSEALIDPAERDSAAPPSPEQLAAVNRATKAAIAEARRRHYCGGPLLGKSTSSNPRQAGPSSIVEAMHNGLSNEEIRLLIKTGVVQPIYDRGTAMRVAPADYQELLRRGLI